MTNALFAIIVAAQFCAFDYSGESGAIPVERAAFPKVYNTAFSQCVNENDELIDDVMSVNAYFANPYNLETLKAFGSSASYYNKKNLFSVSWNSFGNDVYAENNFSLMYFSLFKYFAIGSKGNLYNIKIEQDKKTFYDFDFSSVINMSDAFKLSFLYTSFRSAVFKKNTNNISSIFSAGFAFNPYNGICLNGWINNQENEYYYICECDVSISKNLALKFYYAPKHYTQGISANVTFKNISLDYSFSNHTMLGSTHRFAVSFRNYEERFRLVDYGKLSSAFFVPIYKIDIQTCSQEDLMQIEGMSEDMASRLISYREMFGDVTKKSLIQIGFASEMVNKILSSTKNIAEEEKYKEQKEQNKYNNKKKYGISKVASQNIFKNLVESNIETSVALEISRNVSKYGLAFTLKTLNKYGLTDAEKNEVKRRWEVTSKMSAKIYGFIELF